MATYLYRLGGWAFQNRGKVVTMWGAVLVGVILCAVAFAGTTNDEFSVPGTESQEAQDLLHDRYPGAGGASARIVFVAPEGETLNDPENKAAIKESMALAANAADVEAVIDPFASKAITADGTVGFADVIYPDPAHEIDDEARDALEASADPAKEAGMQVEFGGGLVTDESEESSESTGLIIAFVVLALALTSMLAAVLPLVIAVLSVAHRTDHHHGPVRHDHGVRGRAHPGYHARPCGRDRLHTVHPGPAPAEPRGRSGTPGGRRTSHGNRRKRSGVRGPDRGHRTGRSDDRQHPVPHGDGPGGRQGR